MIFPRLLLILSLFSIAFSQDNLNSIHDHDTHVLPRPLILEYPEFEEEVRLRCTSWRFAVEANNLSPWKTIPEECAEYVKEYMMGRGYAVDLDTVSKEAGDYAKTLQLGADGNDAWIFDIDETLLSNLPYYAAHGYGLEGFDHEEFNKWVEKGVAPAIEPSLKLYEDILNLGFKVILLTGRSERHRSVTVDNLINAGFREWHQLILRAVLDGQEEHRKMNSALVHFRRNIIGKDTLTLAAIFRAPEDQGKLATIYKSEKRSEMEKDGFRILGNSGDQWSDLLGSSISVRSFKLPNPMYYIP